MPSASSTAMVPDVRRDKDDSHCVQIVTDGPDAFDEDEARILLLHYETLGHALLDESKAATDEGAVQMVYSYGSKRRRVFVLFKVFVRADISIRSAIRKLKAIGLNAVAFMRNPGKFRPITTVCTRAKRHKSEHHGCTHPLRRNVVVGAPAPGY